MRLSRRRFHSPTSFTPGVSTTSPPNGSGSRRANVVVCRRFPVYPLMAMGMAIAYAFNGTGDMLRPLVWDFALLIVVQGTVAFVLGGPEVLGVDGFFVALTVSGVLQGIVPAWLLSRRRWVVAQPRDGRA